MEHIQRHIDLDGLLLAAGTQLDSDSIVRPRALRSHACHGCAAEKDDQQLGAGWIL